MTAKKPNPRDVLYPRRLTSNPEEIHAYFKRMVAIGDRYEVMAEACRRLLNLQNAKMHRWQAPDGTKHCVPYSGSMEADADAFLSVTAALQKAMATGDTEKVRDAARLQGQLFNDLIRRHGLISGTTQSEEELAATQAKAVRGLLSGDGPKAANEERKNGKIEREKHARELAEQSGKEKIPDILVYIQRYWSLPEEIPKERTLRRYLEEK